MKITCLSPLSAVAFFFIVSHSVAPLQGMLSMSCSWLSKLMLLGDLPPDELCSEGPSGAGLLPEGAADFFSEWRDPMAPHVLASWSRCAILAPRWGAPGTLGTCSHSRHAPSYKLPVTS